MITLANTTATWESWESVLFQPVLKAYPMCHSWIIRAHVSLGNLEKQWKTFIRQMERMQPLLNSIQQKPLAPTHLISTLQAEFTNLDSIYTSHKPLISAATHLLKKGPSFDGISTSNWCTRRSLLPFLGDALSWLTGTATTKDVSSINKRINQLITTQNTQETLVHIICVLNITRYATQVNRQHINIVVNTEERTHQDVTILYNITFIVHQPELSADHTSCLLCFSKSLRFAVLYESSHHAYHALYRCSHNRNTFTSCTTSGGSQENPITQ